MFSFFKKDAKKSSPPSSPESDPIPSNSDFVMVNDPRQGGANPNQPPYPTSYPNQYPLYPNFGQHFGPPGMPPVPPTRPQMHRSESIHPTTYVHDVPFKLSSELSLGNSDEITRIQVDDILSLITSKMGVSQIRDYDFTLERSILQQYNDTTDASDADAPPAEEEAEEE